MKIFFWCVLIFVYCNVEWVFMNIVNKVYKIIVEKYFEKMLFYKE